MALHIVTGSPGSGKSTWVRHTAKPGDIQIGSDELTNALTGKTESKHHHDQVAKKISRAARDAAIAEAIKHRHQVDVWILISNLTEKDATQWRKYGARFVVIDPGYDIAMQRCKANRPGYKHRLVDSWYARRDEWPSGAQIIQGHTPPEPQPTPKTTTPTKHQTRGNPRGHRHQKRRTQLLTQLKDGTPCAWCGRPMHRDQDLHADHEDPMKVAGDNALPNRLMHGACNEQRQEGENDRRAPARRAPDAFPMLPIRMKDGGLDSRYPSYRIDNNAPAPATSFQWG